MSADWTENAERVYAEPGYCNLIGEDDRGDWRVWLTGDTWVPFCWWNPRHAFYYLRSRRTNQLVWLERAS